MTTKISTGTTISFGQRLCFNFCADFGTSDQKGLNTTGSDLEINAFKNIIGVGHGKRKAYTDSSAMPKSRQITGYRNVI